jgi:hypothetical protein
MAAPTTDAPSLDDQPDTGEFVSPVRLRWWIVVLFGLWSVLVWSARTVNLWRDLLLSTDEKVVLTVMAGIFVVLGLAVALIGLGLRKWAPTRVDIIAVGVLGGWTCGVWFLRIVEMIASGDHGTVFIAVHVVLAGASIALAAWSWQELAAARPLAFGSAAGDVADGEADSPVAEDPGLEAGSVAAQARQ